MLYCKFCQKECKNENSQRNHERLCKENPDRQESSFVKANKNPNKKKSNQFTSGKMTTHSEETKKKLAKSSTGKVMSEQSKEKLRKIAIDRGLGGHTSKQKLYFQKKNGDIVYLQSSYEIKFAEILEDLNIIWERPQPLIWVDSQNKHHKYYPDFKIGNIYIDTKNDYLAIKDLPKINCVRNQNDVDIRIVTKDQINKEFIALIV